MSLRWRLTLYYSLLSVLVIVLSGTAFFVILRQSLQQSLDTSLREVAELAADQLSDEQRGLFSDAQLDLLLESLSSHTTLAVFDAQEHELEKVGQLRNTARLVEGFSDVDGHRVYTLRLANGNWVQTLRSSVETVEAISRAQRLLLTGLPFLLLVGLGVGYFLADSALKPVDRVTLLAESITRSGHFRERVPESRGNDEMARLTRTFNTMLGRLETTLEREKAFALAAAHELRTPLTFLQGRASLSLEKPRKVEHYQRDLQQIHATTKQMNQTVDSLLSLARTNQPPKWDTLDVTTLFCEVMTSNQEEAAQRAVKLECRVTVAHVYADKSALKLALGNLLQNALKYGREGGHVWLKSGQNEPEVFLEVCDDGPGVPESEWARLVQPFQRGNDQQGVSGSGLGLALASAIAEQHGGRLELRQTEEGFCATLILPPCTETKG